MNRIARILSPEPPGRVDRHDPRGVLCLDTSDETGLGLAPVSRPSPELLDRALAGWERFLSTFGEAPDE